MWWASLDRFPYLSADGTILMEEPQDMRRLATTEEIGRSLVRRGEGARCTWDGISEGDACRVMPSNGAPLWARDEEPIHYWSADAYSAEETYYVSYNGRVGQEPRHWGKSRHGYRCVREP